MQKTVQVVIEIDESLYNAIKQDIYINGMRSGKTILQKLVNAIANGTPIPDNATNGEVMEIMFAPNRITRTDDIIHVEYDFTPKWWDAPYQKGGKE